MWVHKTMIVTAAMAPLARALAAGLEPVAAAGMFVVGLCPKDGPATAEPTRFVSSGAIDEQFAPMLTDAAALHAACGQFGVSLEECQALVDSSVVADVAEEGPFDTFDRLDLQLVQPPEEE